MVAMTNWEYVDAIERIHRVLLAQGVYDKLRQLGASEGDNILIGELSETMTCCSGFNM
jgi:Obg family GTPase CgtA-like protein